LLGLFLHRRLFKSKLGGCCSPTFWLFRSFYFFDFWRSSTIVFVLSRLVLVFVGLLAPILAWLLHIFIFARCLLLLDLRIVFLFLNLCEVFLSRGYIRLFLAFFLSRYIFFFGLGFLDRDVAFLVLVHLLFLALHRFLSLGLFFLFAVRQQFFRIAICFIRRVFTDAINIIMLVGSTLTIYPHRGSPAEATASVWKVSVCLWVTCSHVSQAHVGVPLIRSLRSRWIVVDKHLVLMRWRWKFRLCVTYRVRLSLLISWSTSDTGTIDGGWDSLKCAVWCVLLQSCTCSLPVWKGSTFSDLVTVNRFVVV